MATADIENEKMVNPNWQRAKEIFIEALQQKPEERAQFLDQSCEADADLRREVESLLNSYEDAESFMIEPAVAEVADVIVPDKTDKSGKSFGNYEIVELIGTGGMGEVYRAKDKKLDRFAAVKILNEKFSRHQSNLDRFIREAKAASALNHPNILVIYEVGETEDIHYIASEFIEGITLRDRIRSRPMKLADILDIAIQICNALMAAHTAKIVHRDIKPENIMIRPDGYVKVLDFGLAKLIEQKNKIFLGFDEKTLNNNQTAKGIILGTVNYMSPEQAKGELIDERTDIFSLGAVIYEMISGKSPFAADSMSEVFANLITTEPQPLSRFTANVPDELQRIVSKTLKKKREERYQTIKDLFTDLKHLQNNLVPDEKVEHKEASTDTNVTIAMQAMTGEAVLQTAKINFGFFQKFKNFKLLTAVIAFLLMIAAAISFSFYIWTPSKSALSKDVKIKKSLAVLPFVNASQDANAEYLSDGITESLINNLSQLSNLKVTSGNSTLKFKDDQSNIQSIASQLGVETLVTGDVKQLNGKLVINVHLINASDDSQIWGTQYVKNLDDVLVIQNEIAQTVAQNLQLKLSDSEKEQLRKNYTENPEAYQLYLKGQYEWKKHTEEDLLKSIEYYNQALEKDPNYALAYFGLSAAYGVLSDNYLPPNETAPKARANAAKALALDETLAQAHTAMGAVNLLYDWNWAETERQLKRAQALDPNDGDAHDLYDVYLQAMGRIDEAKAETKHSQAIDPLSLMFSTDSGIDNYFARQYPEAIAQLEKTLNLDPHYNDAYFWLGEAYEQNKMYARAIETYQKGMDKAERHPQLIASLAHTYALAGERDKANKLLDELREMSKRRYVSSYWFALIYLGMGDKEQVFTWLNKAYQDRSSFLLWLKMEPRFDPLRDDPRFQELLQRIGLEKKDL